MHCIKGHTKTGKNAWIGDEGTSLFFADKVWDTALVTATGAKGILKSVAKMDSYYRGSTMDLASFRVHEVSLETKPVAPIGSEIRNKLEFEDSVAPTGWHFLITDSKGERYAASLRHWNKSTSSLMEAVATTSLKGALQFLDRMEEEGWRIVVGHLKMDPNPLPNEVLESKASAEKAVENTPVPDEDLSGEEVYVPRFR